MKKIIHKKIGINEKKSYTRKSEQPVDPMQINTFEKSVSKLRFSTTLVAIS